MLAGLEHTLLPQIHLTLNSVLHVLLQSLYDGIVNAPKSVYLKHTRII